MLRASLNAEIESPSPASLERSAIAYSMNIRAAILVARRRGRLRGF